MGTDALLADRLARIIPWGGEVAREVMKVCCHSPRLPTLKVAIVLIDFFRFDSISTSASEHAIVLSEAGFNIDIICNNFSGINERFIKSREEFAPNDYDLIIYHYYVGDALINKIIESETYKVVYYQGITTPPHVYEPYSPEFAKKCKDGLAELKNLYKFDYVLSGSEWNINQIKENTRKDKKDFNYKICPPIISVKRFQSIPRKKRSPINILTVCRIYSLEKN